MAVPGTAWQSQALHCKARLHPDDTNPVAMRSDATAQRGGAKQGKAMTQTDELLTLMQERSGGVTPLEALYAIGCMRLAARVHDLRAEGWDIWDEMVTVTARNGREVRVKRYGLRTRPAA